MDDSLDDENVEDIQRRFEEDFLPKYGDMWRKIIEEQAVTAPTEDFLLAIQSGQPMSFQVHSKDKDCGCNDCVDPVLEWENPSPRDNDHDDSQTTETEEEFEAPQYSEDEESYTGPSTPLAEGFQETFGNFGFGDANPPRYHQNHFQSNGVEQDEKATSYNNGNDENTPQNQVTPESDGMEKYNVQETLPRTIVVSTSPETKRTPVSKNEKDQQHAPTHATYSYENETSQSFASAQPYQSDIDGTPHTPPPRREQIEVAHEQLFSPQPNPQFTPTDTQNNRKELIDHMSPSSQSSASSGFHMDLSYLVVSPKLDNNEELESQDHHREDLTPPAATSPSEQTCDSDKAVKANQTYDETNYSAEDEASQTEPASDFGVEQGDGVDAQSIVGVSDSEDDDSFDEGPVVRPTPNRRRIVVDSSDEDEEPSASQTSRTGRTRPRRAPKQTYLVESSDESSDEYVLKSDSSEASFDSPDELSLNGMIHKKFCNTSKSDLDYTDENQHPNTMKAKGKTGQSFKKDRVQLSLQFFSYYNQKAFDGALTGVDITWSNKLRTTAGLTRLRKSYQAFGPDAVPDRKATIELSSKVLDSEERLQSTLLHEMVHAAAWLVDGVSKPPHGDCFKKWAKCAMRRIPGMKVTTTHDYEIHFKYAWACTAPGCTFIVKRHSRSVDPKRHCCGRCRSKLVEVDISGKNGSKAPTVKKPTELSGYNLFVKEQSASVRRRLMEARKASGERNPKVSQPEVMKECAKLWKARKSLQAS
eukprot:Nitzschia sp. Nitz4//scaffold117_size69655//21345//23615//NITZ4_006020-RA/size69655-processed-gene-0.38-mRNA-1//-1//CDS//3329533639//5632//frame0